MAIRTASNLALEIEANPSTHRRGPSGQPPIITNIAVNKLFGRYSYSIPEHQLGALPGEYNRLILLYGDNGSGKTTILRLVFHLLSPSMKRGHRTFIANTPFRTFSLALGDGTTIVISRDNRSLLGSYDVLVKHRGKHPQHFPMHYVDGNLHDDDKHHDKLIEYLKTLRAFPYYLTDNRSFTGDTIEDEEERFSSRWVHERWQRDALRVHHGSDFTLTLSDELPRNLRQGQELISAMRRAERWLQ